MTESRSDQEQIRIERRQKLVAAGVDVYPARTNRVQTIADIRRQWKEKSQVIVAGRILSIRRQGGSTFVTVADDTSPIQVFLQKKSLGTAYDQLVEFMDRGDFLEFTGSTFTTARGEPTIDAVSFRWLTKSLRPLPTEHFGLEDIEQRYRFREVDLLVNDETKKVFIARGLILKSIRAFLDAHHFTEVETPMLQTIPGGATARPFMTHHHALDVDLYLRVAPELFLKRLIVGGLSRVFELGRNFRNEGIDRDHNPEFTMLECYAAYTDYQWMMDFTEDLLIHVATAVHGQPEITIGKKTIRLKKPFPRIEYQQAILHMTKIDIDTVNDDDLRREGRKIKTDLRNDMNRAQMIDEIFKTHVRPKYIEPSFIYDYPLELSPLAKKKPGQPKYTERFQLLAAGTELGNAFSELNDPIDQRQRFEDQEKYRAKGDQEAQRLDETFLRSLEYGLPPTSGLGIGIDRLTALLTNQPALKDVVLFPTLRPSRP